MGFHSVYFFLFCLFNGNPCIVERQDITIRQSLLRHSISAILAHAHIMAVSSAFDNKRTARYRHVAVPVFSTPQRGYSIRSAHIHWIPDAFGYRSTAGDRI